VTKPNRDPNLRWLGFLPAALVAVLVALLGAGTGSAATATAAQTRVGPHTLIAPVLVGPHSGIGAGQRLGNDLPAYDFVLATGVAAKSAGEAADLVRAAKPIGSALKNDAWHRSASFAVDDIAKNGTVFRTVGGDGVSRTLIQTPGQVNGIAGRFEWIVDGEKLTHQMFVRGGTINGIPIKP